MEGKLNKITRILSLMDAMLVLLIIGESVFIT